MTSPSQEHLLGYLLGALEPCEQEQFERELAASPELQAQLAKIGRCLQPLDVTKTVHEPPLGLARRTCDFVFEEAETTAPVAAVTPARQGVPAAMSADYTGVERHSSWTMADMVVAAGIFLAAGMLFFPAIANSRYQAQLAQCQNNLRYVGDGMLQYSGIHRGEYPTVTMAGNRSSAGIQAAYLREHGYLDRDSLLYCPGSPQTESLRRQTLPTLQQLDAANGEELVRMQRQMGGTTAFSLGYHDGQFDTIKCCKSDTHCRSTFALASDAPTGAVPNMVSNHHDGKGQNVVFEDGHVAYVKDCGTATCGDPLFWNRENRVEAGLCPEDIVLATSGTPPMARVKSKVTMPDEAR